MRRGEGPSAGAQMMHEENASNRVSGSKSTSCYSSVILMKAVVSLQDLQESIYLQRSLFSAFLPQSAGEQPLDSCCPVPRIRQNKSCLQCSRHFNFLDSHLCILIHFILIPIACSPSAAFVATWFFKHMQNA